MSNLTRQLEQLRQDPARCADAMVAAVESRGGAFDEAILRRAVRLIVLVLGVRQPDRCLQILNRLADQPELAPSYFNAFSAADLKGGVQQTRPSPAPVNPELTPNEAVPKGKRILDKQDYARRRLHVLPERTPVRFRFILDGKPTAAFDGVLRDISREGLGVFGAISEQTVSRLERGSAVEVLLQPIGYSEAVAFSAAVRWLLPDRNDQTHYHFGAQFVNLSPSKQDALNAFLLGMALEKRRSGKIAKR